MTRHAAVAVVALAVAGGCSRSDQAVGAFTVRWQESPAQLVVSSHDGRELLRTSGLALESRASLPTWESQFGAYKLTEDDAPWHGAATLTADASSSRVVVDFGGGRKITVSSPKDGELDLALEAPAADNRIRARFACAASDHFLGFGSQADAVDHHGHKIAIWISEPGIGKTDQDDIPAGDAAWMLHGTRHAASYPLPAFLTNRGTGAMAFLADTTRRSVFDLCQADPATWTVEAWDRAVTLKLFDAPEPAKAIEALTADIGRQPLANDLAFAPWNDAIFGSAHVREIAALLRRERIPSGALWTEDFRGGDLEGENYRLKEEWDVDRALYPDVEQVAKELHAQGFRWLAYHNTFLNSGTQILKAAQQAGVAIHDRDGNEDDFTGVKFTPSSLVDLTHPQGPAFVTAALDKLVGYGFDGWMSDYGEWLPPDAVLANGDAEALHNDYPRQYFAAVMASLAHHPHPELASVFVRSGSLHAAPLQPVVWAGDQWTNLLPDDGLPTVVTMGLNLGLGGVAIYGHDLAGYQNGTFGPSSKETFFRWTVVGALSPVMRTHHGTKALSNWWFGKDEETVAHYRRWSRLHARLWPYLRRAAQEAFDHGLPIMRQLALAFPHEERAWTLSDEYLFGPSLLVAPVMKEGATGRSVWLPPGQWMPFEGGPLATGPADVTVPVPLTEGALFVLAGTILPLLPDRLDTLMPADPPLVDLAAVKGERSLLLFGGAGGTTTDLDGTTYTLGFTAATAPDGVTAGAALPACGAATTSCFTLDAAHRSVTVTADRVAHLAFRAGGQVVATLDVAGATQVTEVVYRY